jgi:hypothetical protein
MTTEQIATLVLKDEAGTYYLLSQETLEQGRVPEERIAELEQFIAAAADGRTGKDDVDGHAVAIALVAAPFVAVGLMWGLEGLRRGLFGSSVEQVVPDVDYSGVGSREPLP